MFRFHDRYTGLIIAGGMQLEFQTGRLIGIDGGAPSHIAIIIIGGLQLTFTNGRLTDAL